MTRLISFDTHPSRRRILAAATVIAGLGLAASAALAAPIMRTQKAVKYQDTPKGRARCDNCSAWLAPDACKIVSGTIKPEGWCTAYAPKA